MAFVPKSETIIITTWRFCWIAARRLVKRLESKVFIFEAFSSDTFQENPSEIE